MSLNYGMNSQYVIPDVPIEICMHVSRMISISPKPLDKNSILKGMDGIAKTSYVDRSLALSQQLGMIDQTSDKKYVGNLSFKEDFSKTTLTDFPIIARKALQNFAPFLLYIENISHGYDHAQSARIVSGIYELMDSTAVKFFKKSGIYCGLLEELDDGFVKLTNNILQDLDYLENLKIALKTDIESKSLISNLLSSDAFLYFSSKGIDFNRPAKALTEIKLDPKASLYKIFEFAELCLYALGMDMGARVQNANGIGELIDSIRSQQKILVNPTNLGKGLGSLRNMSNHGPDKETGKTWTFTEETSFGTSLLILRYLRSIYHYHKNKLQEI